MGRLDAMDEQLFLLAALDFASQLKDSSTRHTFRSTFQAVSHLHPVYARLVEQGVEAKFWEKFVL